MTVPLAKGNIALLNAAHKANVALGERAVSSDFVANIKQHPEITFLIRTAQLPELKRGDPVEDQGQFGQGFSQYGAVKRDGDMAFQIVEIKLGQVGRTLSSIINNKEYVDIEITMTGEDMIPHGYELQNCVISTDAVDLDTENRTGPVRIPMNARYNWFEEIGGYAL